MESRDCDVVIIGAGFAGAAAALEFARLNLRTVIVEARARVGGRAYTRAFATGEEMLEFGGSWIAPWHERIRRHARTDGIDLRPTHEIAEHRWHDGKTLRSGLPCGAGARSGFDRAMARIRADAIAYRYGDASKTKLSLNQYLDLIGAPSEARVHVLAWWTISGNGDPEQIAATEFLSSCAYGDGAPQGMMTALRHTLIPGASILVERMIARSGAELRLNAAVAAIEQRPDGVDAIIAAGERVRARCAAVCVPLNGLRRIAFSPDLTARKQAAISAGHGGKAVKVWIKARGVREGTLATGGGNGLQWMFAERKAADGAALIVGSGLDDGSIDPESRHDMAAALNRLFPEAELIAWDWHDWLRDPWARGTWVATPVNMPWIADHREWQPEGRVAFATSDFSHDSPGWFEAAIASGEAAAQAIAGLMSR
ncbi:MAG: flavin monoamine oxidase family protein [Hyphomicrobiales bacterium]